MTSRAGTTTRLEFTEEMRRVLGRCKQHECTELTWRYSRELSADNLHYVK